jgi:putative protein kinase ArgK-like GTPase of G3E family
VLMTQAAADIGIDAVVSQIERHRAYLNEHRDPERESERRAREFMEVLASEIEERTARALHQGANGAQAVVEEVRHGNLNPYSAVRRIIEDRAMISDLLADVHNRIKQE